MIQFGLVALFLEQTHSRSTYHLVDLMFGSHAEQFASLSFTFTSSRRSYSQRSTCRFSESKSHTGHTKSTSWSRQAPDKHPQSSTTSRIDHYHSESKKIFYDFQNRSISFRIDQYPFRLTKSFTTSRVDQYQYLSESKNTWYGHLSIFHYGLF